MQSAKMSCRRMKTKNHPLYTQALTAEFKNMQNKAPRLIINYTTSLLKAIHSLYQSEGHIQDDTVLQSHSFKAHATEYPPSASVPSSDLCTYIDLVQLGIHI